MDVFHAIVLGIVQGLTEFLPISSSGHLILIPWLFGWDDGGLAFDAALHLGTLFAVFVYFWRELLGMLKAVPDALKQPKSLLQRVPLDGDSERVKSARLLWMLVIGSIPGGVAGLLLQGKIDDFFHGDTHIDRAIILISLAMIVVAIALWYADRTARHRRAMTDLMPADAFVIGLAQMLALFPGVSRSGSTLTAGLLRDLRRPDAASFSFLLGTPLITLAALKGLFDLITNGTGGITGLEIAAGIISSAVTGFFTITFLLRYLKRSSVTVFVVYRIAAGIIFIGIALSSWR